MRFWLSIFLLLLGVAIIQSCGNCTYAKRLVNPQCRPLEGSIFKSKNSNPVPSSSPPPPPPPPSACSGSQKLKLKISCSSPSQGGAATLCDSRSNGAPIRVFVFPDNGSTAISTARLGKFTSCKDLFQYTDSQGTPLLDLTIFATTEIAAVYNGDPTVAGQFVTCDSNGCNSLTPPGCFTNFDPTFSVATGNLPVNFTVGQNYLVCAWIDSYKTLSGSSPPNYIPPFLHPPIGNWAVNVIHPITIPIPYLFAGGGAPAYPPPNEPPVPSAIPAVGDTQNSFVQFTFTTSMAPLNLNIWGDTQ